MLMTSCDPPQLSRLAWCHNMSRPLLPKHRFILITEVNCLGAVVKLAMLTGSAKKPSKSYISYVRIQFTTFCSSTRTSFQNKFET